MEIGTILIWLSFIFAILVVATSLIFLLTKKNIFKKLISIFLLISILLITITYILLTQYFLTSNYDIHYVWYHSSKNTEWYLKLTGVWAGQEGSLLLWVWIILISLGFEEFIQFFRRRKSFGGQLFDFNEALPQNENESFNTYDWTRLIVVLISLVFLILLVLNDPFEPTHSMTFNEGKPSEFTIYAEDYPAGHGMNPMLRNPWMVIHPPLLFLGYAFITIPFAASLSYSITNDKNWTKISLQWSRLAWLFLTLGIGIGAVWAYIALGWGGYWAWDPVEVGSLIPWITLSAFMHTQLMNKRKNHYKYLTPILGTSTFVLVIFATFITRSGMWTSVHAWSETEVGLILLATMIIILFFSGIIILRAFVLNHNRERDMEMAGYFVPEERMDIDTINMLITVIVFIVSSFIILYVLMVTMGEVKPEEYEIRLTPIIIMLMAVLSICLCWRFFGKENSIYIIAWTSLAAVASSVLVHFYNPFPGTIEDFYGSPITTHDMVGFMIPFIILLIIAAIYKIVKSIKLRSKRTSVKTISAHIIHLGIAFIILGYIASQTMIVEKTDRAGEGDSIFIGEYEIVIEKINVEVDSGDLESREYWDTWYVKFDIYKNGEFVQKGEMNVIFGYNFDQQGRKFYSRIMTSEVFVGQMITEDLYLSPIGIENNEIIVTSRTIPMMSFLWAGMILFIVGIIVRMVTDRVPDRAQEKRLKRDLGMQERTPKNIRRRLQPIKEKSKKDYDKMLEDELKRLRS
jgi:cytochrome c-type biogenesis protein CcmF